MGAGVAVFAAAGKPREVKKAAGVAAAAATVAAETVSLEYNFAHDVGILGFLASGVAGAFQVAKATVQGGAVAYRHVLHLAGSTVVLAPEVGALGAEQADREVLDTVSYDDIIGGESYRDTLKSADGDMLYIGEFVGRQPHGKGHAFWPLEQSDALLGRFINGKFVEGFIIDDLGVVVGHFRVEDGAAVVDGWQ